MNIHWSGWCWGWSANTLATWCEELTHWKRPSPWERLKVGGEGHDRGWDGWMASQNQWTRVWASSRRWWMTGKLGVLQFKESDMTEWLNRNNGIMIAPILSIKVVFSAANLFPSPLRLFQWLSSRESACNAEDIEVMGSIPGLGRSPGGGNGNFFKLLMTQKMKCCRLLWQAE